MNVASQSSNQTAATAETGGASSTRSNPFRVHSEYFDHESWHDLAASQVSAVQDPRRNKVRQSPSLPNWLWWTLAKFLGAPTKENDRPIFATFLYVCTMTSSLTYGISNLFYIGYDAESRLTTRTYSQSVFDIILTVGYCAMGSYGMELGYKILVTQTLRNSVRMHARTVLKINAVILMSLFIFLLLAFSYLSTKNRVVRDPLSFEKVGLPILVFYLVQVSQVVYATFCGLWNFICGWFLLSICRTHTIAMRRLNRDLEFEGKIREHIFALKYPHKQVGVIDNNLNINEDLSNPSAMGYNPHEYFMFDDDVPPSAIEESLRRRPTSSSQRLGHFPDRELITVSSPSRPTGRAASFPGRTTSSLPNVEHRPPTPRERIASPEILSEFCSIDEIAYTNHLYQSIRQQNLSQEELETYLLDLDDLSIRYWKQNRRLQITSIVFQRWLASWITFAIFWIFSFLISWLSQKHTILYDIFEVFLPLLLLVLLCSAYAEVNNEGRVMQNCVYPTPERVGYQRLFFQQPLQMTLFSSPMNYQAITTIIGTLAIAFSSKIILDTLSTKSNL